MNNSRIIFVSIAWALLGQAARVSVSSGRALVRGHDAFIEHNSACITGDYCYG
jgi:hypothetical protein